MELEELSVTEKAAMLSGGSEWDSRGNEKAGIPNFVMSDGPHGVRRQLGEGDHLGLGHPSPPPASRPPAPLPAPGIRRSPKKWARHLATKRTIWT